MSSRPQVSIDRLAPRRATAEPRESMNCKSCRKRKIKCNRMRPSCEACKVFQCPCIYDAIPKKRGPKTDMLEALLKRVDGLERRLQDEINPAASASSSAKKLSDDQQQPLLPADDASASSRVSRAAALDSSSASSLFSPVDPHASYREDLYPPPSLPAASSISQPQTSSSSASSAAVPPQTLLLPDSILDTYFTRLHGKPFHILDEQYVRQKHQSGQLSPLLAMAVYALTLRYTAATGTTTEHSARTGLEFALQARRAVDIDNPSIEGLQTLLLLSQTFFAHASCAGMVIALDLYRELPPKASQPPFSREMRRRLFWAAYMMDRFITCGSKRPCLISDHSILLRLPSWTLQGSGLNVEGELFNMGPNIQFSGDSRSRGQGSAASLLIDITRILGVTNRYLAAGGVKGDSHFPWHSLSNLSKIRQELDIWAAGTQDVFASIEILFGHPDSTTLLLSKLIYHLAHCLIYRPFLPIDLVELRGTGQHQSWQIEATNLCFSHSNAIAELVELGKNSPLIEWPAFVGYCVCTAATVHVHGVHYKGREGEVFSSSAEFLAREMNQLSWLRSYWAGVLHQREMLQTLYTCHSELVRNLATSPMRFSPVFHLEDFFDRYPGLTLDSAHVRLVDATPFSQERQLVDRHDLFYNRAMPAPHSYLSQANIYPASSGSTLSPNQTARPFDRGNPQQSTESTDVASMASSLHFPTSHHSSQQQQQQQQQQQLFSVTGTDISAPLPALPHDQSSLAASFSPPNFGFTPPAFLSESALSLALLPPSHPQYATFPFDSISSSNNGIGGGGAQSAGLVIGTTTALTPGAQSQASGSHTGAGGSDTGSVEKDPFLSLLEQLAENEQNSQGGPSELDFFLAGTVDGDDVNDNNNSSNSNSSNNNSNNNNNNSSSSSGGGGNNNSSSNNNNDDNDNDDDNDDDDAANPEPSSSSSLVTIGSGSGSGLDHRHHHLHHPHHHALHRSRLHSHPHSHQHQPLQEPEPDRLAAAAAAAAAAGCSGAMASATVAAAAAAVVAGSSFPRFGDGGDSTSMQ